MKFKSKKDILFRFLILGLNVFLVGITVFVLIIGEVDKHEYWGLILILGVVGLLFWMYFGTNYELSKDRLIYRCGPLKGKIGLDCIKEIVKGKTLWVGFKPATSRNGLIVKYDKYNKIYISPETNESFIEKILELNSDIKVTE
ncbi:PH domain-containing protein [Sinomicrobium sp. M5D2P9]